MLEGCLIAGLILGGIGIISSKGTNVVAWGLAIVCFGFLYAGK